MVAAASGAARMSSSSGGSRRDLVNRPADFWTDETSDVRQRMFTFPAQR